jgi:hypothetical protein
MKVAAASSAVNDRNRKKCAGGKCKLASVDVELGGCLQPLLAIFCPKTGIAVS